MFIRFLISVILLTALITDEACAQAKITNRNRSKKTLSSVPSYNQGYDALEDSISYTRGICKFFLYPVTETTLYTKDTTEADLLAISQQPSNFTIHGYIYYNYTYRSYLEAPYAIKDLSQHMLQTRFDVALKHLFPVQVYITARTANSTYFRKTLDIGLQFDQQAYIRQQKDRMLADVTNFKEQTELLAKKKLQTPDVITPAILNNNHSLPILPVIQKGLQGFAGKYIEKITNLKHQFDSIEKELETLAINAQQIGKQLEAVNSTQAIIEAREKDLMKVYNLERKKVIDTIAEEMDIEKSVDFFATKKAKIKNTIQQKIDTTLHISALAQKRDSLLIIKNKITDSLKKVEGAWVRKIAEVKGKIQQIKNYADYQTLMAKLDSASTDSTYKQPVEGKIAKVLARIKKLGIGRSVLDYTPLSVEQLTITGLQVEVTPQNKWYVAAAAGRVQYQFRDFILQQSSNRNNQLPYQNIVTARLGYGLPTGNHIVATYFQGKKQTINNGISYQRTINDNDLYEQVEGISLYGKYHISEKAYVYGEMATAVSSSVSGKKQSLSEATKNTANQAYMAGVHIDWVQTKIDGYYKKIGGSFQSFTFLPYGSEQSAWKINAERSFFSKKLSVVVGAQKNVFNSPFLLNSYQSSNVFKTLQVSYQAVKKPYLMAGYYPSTQLVLGADNESLYTYRFQTLNAVSGYDYSIKNHSASSNITYSKVFSLGSVDTSFMVSNMTNVVLTHTMQFSKKLSAMVTGGIMTNTYLKQMTIEPRLMYNPTHDFSIQIGLRYYDMHQQGTQTTLNSSLQWRIKQLGFIQLQYDKLYLPTQYTRTFKAIDWGRLTYTRDF